MQLIGKLKKQVENTNSKAEAKEVIADDGMMLTDDELEMASGGEDDDDGIFHGFHGFHRK